MLQNLESQNSRVHREVSIFPQLLTPIVAPVSPAINDA